jgi:hypothetical protein
MFRLPELRIGMEAWMTALARLVGSLGCLLALVVPSLVPAGASAQYVIPGPPAFGSISISIGDYAPQMLRGTAGGPVSLSAVDSSCRGTADVRPSHVIMASGPLSALHIQVQASADSTLMVQLPDGRRLCDDDSGGSLQAMIETSTIAGPVYVWVGSYSGGMFPYALSVSQVGMPMAPPPPPVVGPGGIPQECGMSRPYYGSLRVGDGIILGGHSPWSGPDGQGGYVSADTNWAPEMGGWIGQRAVITSLDGLDAAGCPGVRVTADGGQYFWRIRDARPAYGPPPPIAPPPVVVTPPPSSVIRVTLAPRVPVTLYGPGITTSTVAVWSPRGGSPVEFMVHPSGGAVSIGATVGGVASQLIEIPAALASSAVVTATRRADGQVLFRAERAPEGIDLGQQMLMLVSWSRAEGAPQIAQQWIGTFSDSAPRWAR